MPSRCITPAPWVPCTPAPWVPPPFRCPGALSLGPLLLGIHARLRGLRVITPDCAPAPDRMAAHGPDSAPLWMGVWKGPSSPYHRRIDFKVRVLRLQRPS